MRKLQLFGCKNLNAARMVMFVGFGSRVASRARHSRRESRTDSYLNYFIALMPLQETFIQDIDPHFQYNSL